MNVIDTAKELRSALRKVDSGCAGALKTWQDSGSPSLEAVLLLNDRALLAVEAEAQP